MTILEYLALHGPLRAIVAPSNDWSLFLHLLLSALSVHRNKITAEEFIHLPIAEQAFWSAILAWLRSDEHLIRHCVKQIAQLFFLECSEFNSHEESCFGKMVRVKDGLEHEAKDECNSIACIYIVFSIILTSTDNYHTHTRPVEALAYNQMTQVIDWHKISHHIVKRKEAL